MDIAFHYFTIKTLAVLAGFSDDDAQVIAVNSQLVDDFDFTLYWNCTNVPGEIKNSDEYDLLTKDGWFNPVQTGFLCGGAYTFMDYVYMISNRGQRYTCTPFHFIYQKAEQVGNKEYRVRPAWIQDDSIISELLIQARESLLDPNNQERRKALMKVGMLLHIFADTVAHQMFSGFNADVNSVKLLEVKNNATGQNETEKYRSLAVQLLDKLSGLISKFTPAIGHMMLGHIPDLTYVTFAILYQDEDGEEHYYLRNNTDAFIDVSRKILNYLRSCNNKDNISEDEWYKIAVDLEDMLKKDISPYSNEEGIVGYLKGEWKKKWEDKWKAQYPKCEYAYDSKEIKESFSLETQPLEESVDIEDIPAEKIPFVSTKASDDFYLFNRNADEILIKLYGKKPRESKQV